MEPSFGPQQIWIKKSQLLLYTTFFHVFILWLYAVYNMINIYMYLSTSSFYPHGSHLIYSILSIWVSIMFSWFMIQGISRFNSYHLRYAIPSITSQNPMMHNHNTRLIQTIKQQLSGGSTTSCKESPNVCHSKNM
eukprot:1000211_1